MRPVLGVVEGGGQFPLVVHQTPAGLLPAVLAGEVALRHSRQGGANVLGGHYALCRIPPLGERVKTHIGLAAAGGTIVPVEIEVGHHRGVGNYHLAVFPFHRHTPPGGVGEGEVLCAAQGKVHIILRK